MLSFLTWIVQVIRPVSRVYRNMGALKMQDRKMQDLKMRDQIAGHENAGPENGGPSRNAASLCS